MANYESCSRSNYFKVKSVDEFMTWAATIPGLHVWTDHPDSLLGVYADESWPSSKYDPVGPDEFADCVDIDLVAELAPHLADGQVCVLMESGHEKLRYVSGYAQAFDNTGKWITVSLNDIYALAAKAFPGSSITNAVY